MEGADISKRAKIVMNWEDFLNKYMNICNSDEYDEINNPNGYINLGTGINNMCRDVVFPRLTSAHVWDCNLDLLQYREGYGIFKLRKALATIMTEFLDTHEPVDPEDLICVVGVTACLDILAHCLADPGEAILVPTPVYGRIYTDFMQRSAVKLWPIPIISKENEELCPVLTMDKVKKSYEDAISQKQVVKALLLINPSNPLGDIYSPELLLDIFSFCNERNLHVIMDEVYALSVFNGSPEFYSTLKFPALPNKNKVHVLYGISKDFGIAGLRIGAIHTRCKPLKNCLKQLAFFHDIPFPVMDIAAKFVDDLDWLKMYLSIYRQRISEKFKESMDCCKRMGINVRNSSGGFFLWMDFRPICGSSSFVQERDFFLYLIEKARLYIVPGEELFCAQPGWFRLTFTANPDHVNAGLKRLEEAIKNYSIKV